MLFIQESLPNHPNEMDRYRGQKVFVPHWRAFPNGVDLGVVGEVAAVGIAAGGQWVYPLTRFLIQKPFAGSNVPYLLTEVVWLDSALHVNSRVFLSHASPNCTTVECVRSPANLVLLVLPIYQAILPLENVRCEQF